MTIKATHGHNAHHMLKWTISLCRIVCPSKWQSRPLALMCSPTGDKGLGSVNSELLTLISKEVEDCDRQLEKVRSQNPYIYTLYIMYIINK